MGANEDGIENLTDSSSDNEEGEEYEESLTKNDKQQSYPNDDCNEYCFTCLVWHNIYHIFEFLSNGDSILCSLEFKPGMIQSNNLTSLINYDNLISLLNRVKVIRNPIDPSDNIEKWKWDLKSAQHYKLLKFKLHLVLRTLHFCKKLSFFLNNILNDNADDNDDITNMQYFDKKISCKYCFTKDKSRIEIKLETIKKLDEYAIDWKFNLEDLFEKYKQFRLKVDINTIFDLESYINKPMVKEEPICFITEKKIDYCSLKIYNLLDYLIHEKIEYENVIFGLKRVQNHKKSIIYQNQNLNPICKRNTYCELSLNNDFYLVKPCKKSECNDVNSIISSKSDDSSSTSQKNLKRKLNFHNKKEDDIKINMKKSRDNLCNHTNNDIMLVSSSDDDDDDDDDSEINSIIYQSDNNKSISSNEFYKSIDTPIISNNIDENLNYLILIDFELLSKEKLKNCDLCRYEMNREIDKLSEILPIINFKLNNFNLNEYSNSLNVKYEFIVDNYKFLIEKMFDFYKNNQEIDLFKLLKIKVKSLENEIFTDFESKLVLMKRILNECLDRLLIQNNYLKNLSTILKNNESLVKNHKINEWLDLNQEKLFNLQLNLIEYARDKRQQQNLIKNLSFYCLIDILDRFFYVYDIWSIKKILSDKNQ